MFLVLVRVNVLIACTYKNVICGGSIKKRECCELDLTFTD